MVKKFNPPPGWPPAAEGFLPPEGWKPDPEWPPAPAGWQLIVDDDEPHGTTASTAVSGDLAGRDQAQARDSSWTIAEPGIIWQAKGQPWPVPIGAGTYKLTSTLLYFEKGVLSTNAQQIPTVDILDVDMRQDFIQKRRDVGNVVLHVQRATGIEMAFLRDVPDPRAAVEVINRTAREARLAAQQRATTHYYVGQPPMTSSPSAPEPSAQGSHLQDPAEQLRKLAELRTAGIISEQEFAAKKAEILSRL